MARLKDKVAIITGGARGMGAATSRLFAAEGAKGVIADVLDADGAKLAAEIGGPVRFRHLDVTDEANCQHVIEDTVKTFGNVDALVNNAGVLMFKTLLETSKAD